MLLPQTQSFIVTLPVSLNMIRSLFRTRFDVLLVKVSSGQVFEKVIVDTGSAILWVGAQEPYKTGPATQMSVLPHLSVDHPGQSSCCAFSLQYQPELLCWVWSGQRFGLGLHRRSINRRRRYQGPDNRWCLASVRPQRTVR